MIPISLRYFLTTIDRGSISRAAEELNVAPSAVSRMIKNLEREHHTALIERRARGVVPTEAGQLLAAYSRRLVADAERTVSDIADLRGVAQRRIAIAANQAFASELLPHVVRDLQADNPTLRVSLDVVTTDIVRKMVRDGAADLGVSFAIGRPEGVAVIRALRVPVVAAMAADHPLSSHQRLRLVDVLDYPIALMGPGSTLRSVIEHCAEVEHVQIKPTFTSNNVGVLQAYCASSRAVTFVGRYTVTRGTPADSLVTVPLAHGAESERTAYLLAMEGRDLPASVADLADRIGRRFDAAI